MVGPSFTLNVPNICHETSLNCQSVACNSLNRNRTAMYTASSSFYFKYNVLVYTISKRLFFAGFSHRFSLFVKAFFILSVIISLK